ncbi:MAG: hypothetical protein ACRBFS_14005 [Aureispira sp.]
MKINITLIVFLLFTQSLSALPTISSMSIEEIDLLDLSSWNISAIETVTDQAIILVNDTLKENQQKGHVLLGVIANHLQESILSGVLEEKEAHSILEKLESQQYFITRPTPSNFEKLVCYLCEGRYQYIYKRASHVSGFFPITIITILLSFFCIFKTTKNWTYKKRFIGAIALIALIYSLKVICCNYV